MANRYLIGLVVLVSLFFVTGQGCGAGTGGSGGGGGAGFVGGSDGLAMDFLTDSPPGEVFDQNTYPFDITIRVENKGEDDVGAGEYKLGIEGFSPDDFGQTQAVMMGWPTTVLEGARKDAGGNLIDGTIEYFSFPYGGGMFSYQGQVVKSEIFTVRAKMCYTYETTATALLCYREDTLGINDEGVCEVDGTKSVDSSGSPIHVTRLDETKQGSDTIRFTFDVAHRGTGKIYGPAADQNDLCTHDVQNEDRVLVTVDTGMATAPVCSGLGNSNTGEVTLQSGGKRTITCSQEVGAVTGSYEKVVTITLKYDYEQSKDTSLIVKPSEQ
ncbi:hypothetical protein JXB02_03585 [Candidatus Woesearchaeota archaeon]|nr:hypothetical protein [Candidatus Woesearchaeota archaeon]